MKIVIHTPQTGDLKAEITLDENPNTAQTLIDALPITGTVNRWGDEIYFSTPLNITAENGQTIMEIGDLAFWPPGQAICLFFGSTPVSPDEHPQAASAVNRFGKILEDPLVLRNVPAGAQIKLRRE